MQRVLRTAALSLLLAILVFTAPLAPAAAQSGPTKIVLVRHAEYGKTPGGALGPSLSDAGRRRAAVLADMMSSEGVTLILTTRFRRTGETAAIVGDKLGLKPVETAGDSPGRIVDAQLAAIRAATGTVLVVGHGDTTPSLIAKLGGPRLRNICDDAFDRLFKLTGPEGERKFSPERYGEPSPDPRPNCS